MGEENQLKIIQHSQISNLLSELCFPIFLLIIIRLINPEFIYEPFTFIISPGDTDNFCTQNLANLVRQYFQYAVSLGKGGDNLLGRPWNR